MNGKRARWIWLASGLIVAFVSVGAGGFYCGKQIANEQIAPAAVETVIAQELNQSAIAIPGFDRMKIKAEETEQILCLQNPSANECYFVITIFLPDGEELFRSSKLAPGEELSAVNFNRPLEAGIYEGAMLQYACYSFADLSALNGAEINFTMEVMP